MVYEKLREFYAVFDGIPPENVNLTRFRTLKGATKCDTIACAGGWAAMHPDFQLQGFKSRLSSEGALYWLNKETGQQLNGYEGLARVFGLTRGQAGSIFAPSMIHPQYHHEVFKTRVERFLADQNCFMPGYGLHNHTA